MSNIHGIKGQTLEITVVGCTKLKNTEFISRQDPYVIIEYGNTKIRTKTCTDGGKNPTFHEKYQIPLIEGLHDLNLVVWNSNTFKRHAFIGGGRVQLDKVLSDGYDDSSWMLQCNNSKFAGEVQLIMHFSKPPPSLERCASMPAYPTAPPSPYNNYYNAPVQPCNPGPYQAPVHQVHPHYLNHSSSFSTWQGNNYQQPPVYPPPQQVPVYPPPQQPYYYPPGTYPGYN